MPFLCWFAFPPVHRTKSIPLQSTAHTYTKKKLVLRVLFFERFRPGMSHVTVEATFIEVTAGISEGIEEDRRLRKIALHILDYWTLHSMEMDTMSKIYIDVPTVMQYAGQVKMIKCNPR